MAVVYVKEVGLKRAKNNLSHFIKAVETDAYKVLLEESVRMEREAKLETPVDTGALRNSVKATVTGKLNVTMELSASALAQDGYDYSNIQHENTTYKHPNGGKAFYLRDPFNRGSERIKRRLREEVRYDK